VALAHRLGMTVRWGLFWDPRDLRIPVPVAGAAVGPRVRQGNTLPTALTAVMHPNKFLDSAFACADVPHEGCEIPGVLLSAFLRSAEDRRPRRR
jgi:hypothetical protein